MKPTHRSPDRTRRATKSPGILAAVAGAWLWMIGTAVAFPPAPHHTLFGMVRDELGEPIRVFPGEVILETPSGSQVRCDLVRDLEPGVNYRLEVPMDSGMTDDLYKPTALRPYFQFRLKVVIGQATYLPIEMAGDFSKIGEPTESTRIDLTLGVDTDGDGLPDAWELSQLGDRGGGVRDMNPDDDLDGDGISNLNEYLAGTYTLDPTDGFSLILAEVHPDLSILEFLTVTGRTYSLEVSDDLQTWTPASFQVSGASSGLTDRYRATDVRTLRVEVAAPAGAANRYFKARVQ